MVKTEQAFKIWMDKIDAILIKKCGLTSMDLPDCTYRDWFEDGMTPARAAKQAMQGGDWDG